MEGEFWLLKTPEAKANAAAYIANCPVSQTEPLAVQIKPYTEDRSSRQNRLSHRWYNDVSKQGKEYTPEEVKCIAKLRWGVPIMVAEDADFAAFWEKVKKTCTTYQEQVEAMRFVPVTSLMSVKQMSQYLDHFQGVMSQRYQLTDPSLLGLEELAESRRVA